ncbi:MAG TPA: putative dsRNA-binding protein, partial [Thermomicrobiales bacterium]|nr:putative dsRNA-binding protein [Thermomicrobiales bacterium]
GPAHDRTFTVEASVRGTPLGVGKGASKRDAEQRAAEAALAAMPTEPVE